MRPNRREKLMAVLSPPPGLRQDVAAGIVWAEFLDANRDRFERTLDVSIGRKLGCGLFGCVFSSETPWVVKITRDPTEGAIWSYMAELLQDAELTDQLDSFLRVHDVVRVTPDVIFADERMPVHAIVREEAKPVLREPGNFTTETLHRLGITLDMLAEAGLHDPHETPYLEPEPSVDDVGERILAFPRAVQRAFSDIFLVLTLLKDYRRNALAFHTARGRLAEGGRALRKSDKEIYERVQDEAFREIIRVTERMQSSYDRTGPNEFGSEMGTTLVASLEFADLAFRDLHLFNVGWRMHETIEGTTRPKCMVILDPGAMATPYEPDVRQVELLENVGRYLVNAGMVMR